MPICHSDVSGIDNMRLRDRGWSWPSIIATSVLVGVVLAAMTYYAWSNGRGSVIFGLVMGVGWLAVFTVAKLVREGGESSDAADVTRWLHANWEQLALIVLLALVSLFTAVALFVGQVGLAVVGLVLAIPPVATLGVGVARKRR